MPGPKREAGETSARDICPEDGLLAPPTVTADSVIDLLSRPWYLVIDQLLGAGVRELASLPSVTLYLPAGDS